MGKEEERGPSYYDVTTFGALMREQFGVGHRFEVYPPVLTNTPAHRRSWHIVVRVWKLGEDEQHISSHSAAFGSPGVWQTMPSAMHSCLRDAWDVLEERKQAERSSTAPMFPDGI